MRDLKTCHIVAEGAACYAAERAATERAIRARFDTIWSQVPFNLSKIVATASEAEDAVLDGELDDENDGVHFTVAADVDSDEDPLRDLVDSDEDE